MSDSESSKSGSDSSSSGSESTSSSQSSSSVSSRSSASSKRSSELQRERQGVQESSSDSESSNSTDSSRSSKSSKSSKASAPAVIVTVKKETDGSSSDSSKELGRKNRSASVSSGTSQTSRTTTSTSGTESSDSEGELGRDSARPKEQDGSSSSSESATSTHSSTSSDSDSESSSDSSSSDSESSASEHNADRDTLRMEKKTEPVKETQIKVEISIKDERDNVKVERRNSMDHMDAEEDPAIANNKWVKLGKFFDKLWFSKKFIPVTGSITLFLLVVFSILLDIRVSGEKGLPAGISLIFILIGLLMWAILLFCMGLSRVRYALNIQMVPENGSLFEKSVFNKEGARVAAFYSFALSFILLFVFTILISVHVDTPKWATWTETFIPLWIALGFIGLGVTFTARLLKSYVTLFFHIVITAAMTALSIVVFNKLQGHITASLYKVLVPLWFFDFFLAIFLLWHVASRLISAIPHFVPVFSKSKKEREPDTARDSLASVPLAIAGMFALLFQVCVVIKEENVFIGKYNVTWSVVWLWFWLACAFAWAWCFIYKYKTTSNRSAKRVSKV